MKTYQHHRCTRTHRTHLALAKYMWPRATWITGEGPYAVISRCGHNTRPAAFTVTLHPTIEAATESKAGIDYSGCGGRCGRLHEIIHIKLQSDS